MKEILGDGLEKFFNSIEFTPASFVGRSFKNDEYEVWSVSDDIFNIMDSMSEEDFVNLAGDEAWWRYSVGSVLGTPGAEYEINGHKITAWDERRENDIRFCAKCPIRELHNCQQTEENFDECFGPRKYRKLTEYLCDEIGASSPRNVCACAMDLARYNGITLGELFRKYEG